MVVGLSPAHFTEGREGARERERERAEREEEEVRGECGGGEEDGRERKREGRERERGERKEGGKWRSCMFFFFFQ